VILENNLKNVILVADSYGSFPVNGTADRSRRTTPSSSPPKFLKLRIGSGSVILTNPDGNVYSHNNSSCFARANSFPS
jgi:hypothetical protein